MGWVLMSERELRRVEVLSSVVARRMTVAAAAAVLGVSRRQAHRLLKTYRAEGAAAPPTWGGAAAMQDVSADSPQALSELVRDAAL